MYCHEYQGATDGAIVNNTFLCEQVHLPKVYVNINTGMPADQRKYYLLYGKMTHNFEMNIGMIHLPGNFE